jgi:hypothetical protein
MNDQDDTAAGRGGEIPSRPGVERAPAAGSKRPFRVRFETALRIMRRSEPDLTEDDAVWALWDAVRNQRVTAEIPWSELGELHILEAREEGGGAVSVRPRDDRRAMRAASFDKEELEKLYPPQAAGAPSGEAGSPRLSSRGARGPKPKDFWPKVLGFAAGWLAERGAAPDRQRQLEDVILERIEVLGGAADRSTVRPYAREMLAGYRAQLDDD